MLKNFVCLETDSELRGNPLICLEPGLKASRGVLIERKF